LEEKFEEVLEKKLLAELKYPFSIVGTLVHNLKILSDLVAEFLLL